MLKKYLMVFLIVLMLLIIPASFASDNSSDIVVHEDNQIIVPANVYFDSSVENDGNGTQSNPYKYFSGDKIGDNAIIYMADGEYFLNDSLNIGNITIIGQSRNNTIINGNGNSLSVIGNFDISYLTLNNLRIINAKNFTASNVIFENNHVNEYAGAVSVESTAVSTLINNSMFVCNSAVKGGAIYVDSSSGTFYVDNTTFINNTASESGGAICIENKIDVLIVNSVFINNNASNGTGGSMFSNNSKISIRESNFTGSKAQYGAAIYDKGSELTLIAASVSNNAAENAGGAIYKEEGSLTLISSSFENNTALNGAAVYANNMDSFAVMASNFTSNVAASGKAIYSIANRNEYFIANVINDNFLVNYYKSPDLTLILKDSNPLVLSCVFSGDLFDSQSFTLNYFMPFTFSIVKEIASIFNFDDFIPMAFDDFFDFIVDMAKDAFFPSQKFKFDKGLPPTDISHFKGVFSYLTTLSVQSDSGGIETIVKAGNYNLYNISKSNNSDIMLSLNAFGMVISNDLGLDNFDISVVSANHSFDYDLGYIGDNLVKAPVSLNLSEGIDLDLALFDVSLSDNSLKLTNGYCNVTFDDFTYSVDVLVNGESSSFVYLGNDLELINAPVSLDINDSVNLDFVFFDMSYDLKDNSFSLINDFCNVTFDDFTYSVDVFFNGESYSFSYVIGNNFELINAATEDNLNFPFFNYHLFEDNSFELMNGFCKFTFDNLDYSINLMSNNAKVSGSFLPKFGEFFTISFEE